MQLSQQQFIPAPPAQVYAALNDADTLKRCIPGCDQLEKKSDSELSAKVTLKIGPVKATFDGHVTLSDLNPPHGYTISGEGSGGVAGFAKGSAEVMLEEKDGGTLLSYQVNAQISGKIAQLGSRLIDSTAKKLAAQFFEQLAACLSPDQPAADDSAAAAGEANLADSPAVQEKRQRQIKRNIIVSGAVIVFLLIMLLLGGGE